MYVTLPSLFKQASIILGGAGGGGRGVVLRLPRGANVWTAVGTDQYDHVIRGRGAMHW
jgi:hypothetical protein